MNNGNKKKVDDWDTTQHIQRPIAWSKTMRTYFDFLIKFGAILLGSYLYFGKLDEGAVNFCISISTLLEVVRLKYKE
ncbi:hypothetical protein KAR91_13355 [Candidatus Pacearchaeota archaeon]|nr:hypothetical protein [Candidatus Pacearchaeota archaeon]